MKALTEIHRCGVPGLSTHTQLAHRKYWDDSRVLLKIPMEFDFLVQ